MIGQTQMIMLALVAILFYSGYNMTIKHQKGTHPHKSGMLYMIVSLVLFMIVVDSQYSEYNFVNELQGLFGQTVEMIDI